MVYNLESARGMPIAVAGHQWLLMAQVLSFVRTGVQKRAYRHYFGGNSSAAWLPMSASSSTVIISRLQTHTVEASPASRTASRAIAAVSSSFFRLRVALLMAVHPVCQTAPIINMWQQGHAIRHAAGQQQHKANMRVMCLYVPNCSSADCCRSCWLAACCCCSWSSAASTRAASCRVCLPQAVAYNTCQYLKRNRCRIVYTTGMHVCQTYCCAGPSTRNTLRTAPRRPHTCQCALVL
jgi:hypothetical protein